MTTPTEQPKMWWENSEIYGNNKYLKYESLGLYLAEFAGLLSLHSNPYSNKEDRRKEIEKYDNNQKILQILNTLKEEPIDPTLKNTLKQYCVRFAESDSEFKHKIEHSKCPGVSCYVQFVKNLADEPCSKEVVTTIINLNAYLTEKHKLLILLACNLNVPLPDERILAGRGGGVQQLVLLFGLVCFVSIIVYWIAGYLFDTSAVDTLNEKQTEYNGNLSLVSDTNNTVISLQTKLAEMVNVTDIIQCLTNEKTNMASTATTMINAGDVCSAVAGLVRENKQTANITAALQVFKKAADVKSFIMLKRAAFLQNLDNTNDGAFESFETLITDDVEFENLGSRIPDHLKQIHKNLVAKGKIVAEYGEEAARVFKESGGQLAVEKAQSRIESIQEAITKWTESEKHRKDILTIATNISSHAARRQEIRAKRDSTMASMGGDIEKSKELARDVNDIMARAFQKTKKTGEVQVNWMRYIFGGGPLADWTYLEDNEKEAVESVKGYVDSQFKKVKVKVSELVSMSAQKYSMLQIEGNGDDDNNSSSNGLASKTPDDDVIEIANRFGESVSSLMKQPYAVSSKLDDSWQGSSIFQWREATVLVDLHDDIPAETAPGDAVMQRANESIMKYAEDKEHSKNSNALALQDRSPDFIDFFSRFVTKLNDKMKLVTNAFDEQIASQTENIHNDLSRLADAESQSEFFGGALDSISQQARQQVIATYKADAVKLFDNLIENLLETKNKNLQDLGYPNTSDLKTKLKSTTEKLKQAVKALNAARGALMAEKKKHGISIAEIEEVDEAEEEEEDGEGGGGGKRNTGSFREREPPRWMPDPQDFVRKANTLGQIAIEEAARNGAIRAIAVARMVTSLSNLGSAVACARA